MSLRITLLFLCFGLLSLSVQNTIRGTVTDATSEPLPSVNVVVMVTATGVSTQLFTYYSPYHRMNCTKSEFV